MRIVLPKIGVMPSLRLFLLLLASLPFGSATGQTADYATTTWVYLRQRPSMSGAKLRTLPPNDTLSKRTVAPRAGWVPVRTLDGLAGWVGEPRLRDLHHTADDSGTTVTVPPGSPAARIDS